jgi:hypothetical protein
MTGRVRTAPPKRRQSGLILLLLVGVLGLGATYMMLREFNVAAEFNNSRQLKNALILEEAKVALLMYVSTQVATEAYPGKLPCPEDTSKIGTANEGQTAPYCVLPAVGRLPWKTLGYANAPVDLDGEQLWYAVSPGFNRASVGTTLTINSNTTAGLTVDDSPARAVALIFSPGRALAGQSRSAVTIASPPVAANYLDLENATLDIKFATHGPAGSVSPVFNDQVVMVSHQDLFTVVEPAVAKRLGDTLVTGTKPLTSIYASAVWGTSSTAPVFPYAAPFGDPGTSTFQGTSGTSQGLLPVTFSTMPSDATQYCTTATDGPRCAPTFVKWISFQSIAKLSGGMTLYASPSPSCTVADAQLSCTIYTDNTSTLTINLLATASNVAMALRQLDADAPSISDFSSIGRTASAIFNSDGSSRITFQGRVVSSGAVGFYGCAGAFLGLCYKRTFSIPIRIFADHPIVNSSDSEYGWFTKNDWHKLTYFAIAPGFAASGARSCTAPNCLTITNLSPTPNNNKRAILILAGRPIGVQIRSSGTLSNYLESENLSPIDSIFVTLKPSREFNDRVIVVDTN